MRCHAEGEVSLSEKRISEAAKASFRALTDRGTWRRVLGRAIRLMAGRSVVGARALRASRSSHERREWARLGTGKHDYLVLWLGRQSLRKCDLNPLVAKQLPTGTPMNSPTPVTPEGPSDSWRWIIRTAHLIA